MDTYREAGVREYWIVDAEKKGRSLYNEWPVILNDYI
ncbi:MAG: Uma2 family endonuclease [Lachnospiraceae bacterium]|nr:Uma2 family endonuclease [Lachnospiraceae bacterium]